MKRNYAQYLLLGIVFFWVAFPTGCNKTSTNPATLAPGYINQTDQTLGETLASAHAFYQTLQQDAASGKWTPSAAAKTALNALGSSLNVAQPLYLAYHSGANTVTASQVQTAVADVVNKQSAVQAQIGVK